MIDLKKLGMTELIAVHNELAQSLGVATETSFKSLGAARNAITHLQEKANAMTTDFTSTVDSDTNEDGTANIGSTELGAGAVTVGTPSVTDNTLQKYNSSGKRGPNQGVGAYAKEMIMAGKSNADALAAVLARFPDAKTTTGCIAFYRTALSKVPGGVDPDKLRADAQKLLDQATSIEVARAAKAAADEKAAADKAAAALAAANMAPVEAAPM